MEEQNLLFDSIRYKSPKDVEGFIESLDRPSSFYVITKAMEMAYMRGVYSLIESEILSKSLRILNSEYLKNDDRTNEERNDFQDNPTGTSEHKTNI
jgi:hypothetical protein